MPPKEIPKRDIELYMNAAQSAMFQYQIIEEGLKAYIAMAHEIVQLTIPAGICFNYSEKEYDSMPLERLLNVFCKFCKNSALIKRLNSLRQSRNYVAHRSFALAFLSHVNPTVDFYAEFEKVKAARESAVGAFDELKDELNFISQLKRETKEKKNGV